MPQEHVATDSDGYDAQSVAHLAARRRHDPRLLAPEERAAKHKADADNAFRAKNYRTAYEHYSLALDATPDSHVLLSNRCQAYLKVGRHAAALADAERLVDLAPGWAKGHYRHGCALRASERFGDAVGAFERAVKLEPWNEETSSALSAARNLERSQCELEHDLERARVSSTRRQAVARKTDDEHTAKEAALRAGKIAAIEDWSARDKKEWERGYAADWQPPPGVKLIEYGGDDEDVAQEGDGLNEKGGLALEGDGSDGGLVLEETDGGLVLEENNGSLVLEANEPSGQGSESERESERTEEPSDDEDDAPPAGLFEVGSRAIVLPPRNYTLVHEDGRLHRKDNFEPMSFGMQRVHTDDAPEPVWVQTAEARWLQSTFEVTVIAYTVPKELCAASELRVSFAPRQVHVSARRSGDVYIHGELESRIDHLASTWCTDGETVTLSLVKANLVIYDAQAKGTEADTHWHRLFTHDQYTERGMIAADYSGMPAHIKRRDKMADLARKAREGAAKEANECPLCGKDIRFFCDCRAGDKDYERPLPEGWKRSDIGFEDPIYEGVRYNLGRSDVTRQPPPEQPRPYAGGRAQH